MASCGTCGVPLPADGACRECATRSWHQTQPVDGVVLEAETASLRRGDVLAEKWRLEDKLGVGGMGTVFLAHDLALDRSVAVKFLSQHLAQNPDAVQRFEREGRLTAQLDHPNIVPILDVGRHRGRPFIVMKRLDGSPLSRHLRKTPGPLPAEQILSFMRDLCAGLDCLREKGYVHRDIKPSNIFIGPEGHLTLLDFGVLRDTGSEPMTHTGVALGTLGYMSPEALSGAPTDHRSDIYSVGCVLFELLSGAKPFDGDKGTALARQHLTHPTPELRARSPWVNDAVVAVVKRALAKAPADRFATSAEMFEALETAIRRPPRVLPVRRLAWASAALALVLCVAFAAVAAANSSPAPTAPEPKPTVAVAPTPAPAPPVTTPAPALATKRAPPPVRHAPHTPRPAVASPVATSAPTQGQLRVIALHNGEPTWASVEVDGADRGGTPTALALPIGRHHVKVERSGFRPVIQDVMVPANKPSIVKVELGP